jgi:hypothetical protein
MEDTEELVQDRAGFAFFAMTYWIFDSMFEAMLAFPGERDIVEKERNSASCKSRWWWWWWFMMFVNEYSYTFHLYLIYVYFSLALSLSLSRSLSDACKAVVFLNI